MFPGDHIGSREITIVRRAVADPIETLRHFAAGKYLALVFEVSPASLKLPEELAITPNIEIVAELQRAMTDCGPVIGVTDRASIPRMLECGFSDISEKGADALELWARVDAQIRRAKRIRALKRRENDAGVVVEITQALASTLNFRNILYTVLRRIAEVADVERASIVLVKDGGQSAYVVAASDDENLRDLPIDLAKYPEITSVIQSSSPLVIEDASTHPLLEVVRKSSPDCLRFSSLAIVPILYESKAMGVLFLRARKVAALSERELALSVAVAGAMAIALRNARMVQSLRDQTQEVTVARFEAERRLRSLKRYADFFESSTDGTVVLDAQGRLLFSNPKAREITGYDEETFRTKKFSEVFTNDSRPLARKLKEGFAAGDFPRDVDIGIVRADGERAIVSAGFSAVTDEDGVVLCNFRDVTREREVAAELSKTRDFLQRVIDSSVDAIISADKRGRILVFNPAAERVSGRKAADVLWSDVRVLYPEGGATRVMQLLREGGGKIEGKRIEIVDANGAIVPVSLSAAIITDGGIEVGTVGVFTDLREKMRMEQRLSQAQQKLILQERQAFVASLAGATAHELNQPLQSVMAYTAMIKRRAEKEGIDLGAPVEVILRETERMAEIVKKVGRITKYETKPYVGGATILDLDASSGTPMDGVAALDVGPLSERKGGDP
ncbi:MAG: PAS domain S-box protein [Polyangiaceae bacterium]|nr:PAS domain S-box protein [Polyangiaceae bacterium]